MNDLIAIHPYKTKACGSSMTRQWGLGKNHSFPAPIRSSINRLKVSLTLSRALRWSSRHSHFLGAKLNSNGVVKSSAGTGTTVMR